MKLMGTSTSPYVRKVRIVIAEKRVACDLVVARPSSAEVGDTNPLGKIPCLIRDDGRVLFDSPVLVEFIDGLATQPRLIPLAFEDRIAVKLWEALADGIVDATVAISHEDRLPAAQRKGADWLAKQQKKIDNGLAAMERDLGAGAFCHGETFTLADAACGTALGYLDYALPQMEWRSRFPNLARLSARLAERESFKTTSHPAA